MAQALVPLKDLVQAKTRLAGLLRPSERRALAQAMAEDVLTVLAQHDSITGITLVSDDSGASMLAQKYGADCWSEQALGGGGLNALIHSASTRLLRKDSDVLLVLHADLPLLTVDDISVVLERRQALAGLLIGCDQHGRGTNLLAFDRASQPTHFRFGADSCPAHAEAARSAGVAVEILQRSGIGVDVDEARDLNYVMGNLQLHVAGNTARLLQGTDLGARLALALPTVLDAVAPLDDVNRGRSN